MSPHPKHCPKCKCPWEYESQLKHRCTYCGQHLHGNGIKQFAMYFVPVLAWLLFGVLILVALGKHYNG